MNKFLTFLTFLFCCCMFTATAMASSDSESGNGVVLSPVSDDNNTTDHPRKPAYRPIYGVMTADMITIYNKMTGEAEITLVSATGTTIISHKVADLTCGYPVMLPTEKTGLKVSVLFNGVIYSATL